MLRLPASHLLNIFGGVLGVSPVKKWWGICGNVSLSLPASHGSSVLRDVLHCDLASSGPNIFEGVLLRLPASHGSNIFVDVQGKMVRFVAAGHGCG